MIRRIQEAFSRLAAIFRKNQLDREFDDELDAHLDLLTEQNRRRGLSPEEARRQALLRIGGLSATRELHREARGLPGIEDVIRGCRQAGRSWRSAKAIAVLAAAALTVGIGAAEP